VLRKANNRLGSVTRAHDAGPVTILCNIAKTKLPLCKCLENTILVLNLFSSAFVVLSKNRVGTLPEAPDAGPIAKLSNGFFKC